MTTQIKKISTVANRASRTVFRAENADRIDTSSEWFVEKKN